MQNRAEGQSTIPPPPPPPFPGIKLTRAQRGVGNQGLVALVFQAALISWGSLQFTAS